LTPDVVKYDFHLKVGSKTCIEERFYIM